MKKILHYLVVLFACLVGAFVQPCLAEESSYNSDYINYVPLSLTNIWKNNIKVIGAVPESLLMEKEMRELYYMSGDSETGELVSFSQLEQLPRYPMYKFDGFYTEQNGAGTQIIDYTGEPVREGVNNLPTQNYGYYVNLYPNFLKLVWVMLNPNGGEKRNGTQNILYLKRNATNNLCGIWMDWFGEDGDTSSFVPPEREGYFFDGYYDEDGTEWISSDGDFTVARNLVCDSDRTVNVENLYARWRQCNKGQYKSEEEGICKPCPEAENGKIGDNKLYKFVEGTGTGLASCTVKLNTNKSQCAAGTDVIYTYDPNDGKYKKTKGTIVLGANVFITKLDDEFDPDVDYCGGCDIGGGQYVDAGNKCQYCPKYDDFGNDKLYNFISAGTGSGLATCKVRLNLAVSTCGEGTIVEYAYNSSRREYIRQPGYVLIEGSTPVKTGPDFPSDVMGNELSDYCVQNCPNDEYYVNGGCGLCHNGYYVNGGICKKCPAGYKCSGDSNTHLSEATPCGADEFSEAGATECTACGDGYTTKYSGPISNERDGLCEDLDDNGNGIQCTSVNACRARRDVNLCFDSDCSSSISIGDGAIKIMSTNQSVVYKKTKESGQ